MQNRLQALLLTVLMVGTLVAPAMGANPFFDVPEDHWAYDSISYLAEAGLVEGYPDGTFGGSRNFTRYEMALVFARIVARFEQHVDALIDKGIESRLDELTEQVSAAMKEASLAREASGDIDYQDADALRTAQEAQELARQAMDISIGVLDAIDARGWDERIDEAALEAQVAKEAALQAEELARQAMDISTGVLDVIDARDWDDRIDEAYELAKEALALARIASLSEDGTTPMFTAEARAAVEEIAADVVMDKLAGLDLKSSDANEARALIESEASRIEKALADLTTEFSPELELLGVRVSRLESKFTSLEADVLANADEIQSIRADLDRVKLSGFNETTLIRGSHEGDTPLNDPRDPDSEEFEVPSSTVRNRLYVRLDSKPSDDVNLHGVADLVIDGRFLTGSYIQILEDSRIYVEAETQEPVRVVRVGNLDEKSVSRGFSPYLIDEKEFGETSNIGAYVNIVSGQTEHDVFGAKVVEVGENVAGFSSHIQLNPDMDVTISGAGLFAGANTRTGFGLASTGNFDDLVYNGLLVRDIEERTNTYKFLAELPFESARVQATINRIDKIWSEAGRLPFGAEVKLRQDLDDVVIDKIDDVNTETMADERLYKVRIDVPVGSFQAFAQAGRYHSSVADGYADSFTQFGLYDLEVFGFDVETTRSRFVNQGDEVLTDMRTAFSTKLEDIDLGVQLHNQKNEQADALPGEDEQKHMMLSLAKPIDIIVPWKGTLDIGTSLTATNPMHSAYKLALEQYELIPSVSVNVEIGGENNRIDEGKWRINDNWTGENQTTRAIGAIWELAEPLNILGGYKIVNTSNAQIAADNGDTITKDIGLEYLLDAFGGDLTFGYGYRTVHHNGVLDGAGRSILDAAFTRTAGGFTLDAKAKRAIGGTVKEDGNDVDTIASLQLAYPVFTGADFTVDGKYVSSEGDKVENSVPRDKFKASSLMAGLRFNF